MTDSPQRLAGSELRELADRCGIETHLADGRGESRQVSADTLRAVLGALGIPAASDAAVAESLTRLDEERWLKTLAPVQVVRENEPFEVDIRLPDTTARVRWRLILEAGADVAGEAAFADLRIAGQHRSAGHVLQRRRLKLAALPMGYHRLEVEPNGAVMTIVSAPQRCWLPGDGRQRFSGVSAQLYLLRSQRNWGIGDFADLRELMKMAAASGGDAVGVNPLHALFVDNPAHASPYGPSSRLLLNVLNISVDEVPEYATSNRARALVESAGFRSRLDACRRAELVDYEGVARAKLEALTLLFDEAREAGRLSAEPFLQFRASQSPAFERHCIYLALRRQLAARGLAAAHWRDWPDQLGDSASRHVAEFARERAREVELEIWLQFVADDQLARASSAAKLPVGLYRDLAVGSDANGAETWSDPTLVVPGMQIGAPADALSETGQNWGMPPWSPRQMRDGAYQSFVELVRANMRHAGALRLDHAMALERLFWIPEGASAAEGAYVRYPREDLFAIVALESQRARCMVVGEDLGTVPKGFRERMAAANILSYRVLRFENENGRPIPPDAYPRRAVAVAGNHDVPTLKGWWDAADVALLAHHGVLSAEQIDTQLQARVREKQALVDVLNNEQLLPSGDWAFDELRIAVHRYLGRTQALLALAQVEDIATQEQPVNVPNAPSYSSWRQRVPQTLEELDASGALAAVVTAVARERRAPLRREVGNAG